MHKAECIRDETRDGNNGNLISFNVLGAHLLDGFCEKKEPDEADDYPIEQDR